MKAFIYIILFLCKLIKRCISYNESVPFNWTTTPPYCYEKDFKLSQNYRPLVKDIYPIRGCDSNELNSNYATIVGLNNITFYPKLDFFFSFF